MSTTEERMMEEAAAEQFGEGANLDAHKYSMANLTMEEIDEIKKEKAKLLKKKPIAHAVPVVLKDTGTNGFGCA